MTHAGDASSEGRLPPCRGEPCRMTLVVRLDSRRVKGVGLPACRTSPPCPHQAGGDLIVVVPKVPHLSCGSTDAIEVPLRVSPSLGFTACVTYVCCGAHTPEASNPGLLLGGPGFILSGGGESGSDRAAVHCSFGSSKPCLLGAHVYSQSKSVGSGAMATSLFPHARESSTPVKGLV